VSSRGRGVGVGGRQPVFCFLTRLALGCPPQYSGRGPPRPVKAVKAKSRIANSRSAMREARARNPNNNNRQSQIPAFFSALAQPCCRRRCRGRSALCPQVAAAPTMCTAVSVAPRPHTRGCYMAVLSRAPAPARACVPRPVLGCFPSPAPMPRYTPWDKSACGW
jgi:hypothetical protein